MQHFLARQPILDRRRGLFAYELLFRAGLENFFTPERAAATRVLVSSTMVFDLPKLTGGHTAFFNLTQDALLRGHAWLLPREGVVLEVLESVEPSREITRVCRDLRDAGYVLALDDFTDTPSWGPLVQLASFIKVDFRATPVGERRALVRRHARNGIAMLAEKVETYAEFEQACRYGYAYFQGYFFSQPEIVRRADIPAFKLNYLRILRAIRQPELDFSDMERIIKQEPSLLYKLLRYLNSAALGFRGTVRSVKHAIALLGENEFRRWVSVVALVAMAEDKPAALIQSALLRARFCELLARPLGLHERATDLFLLGLLSMMNAVLDRPLAEILAGLPVAEDVKRALCGESNHLRRIYEAVLAYERGAWEAFGIHAAALALDEACVPACYWQAVEWAGEVFTA